MQLGLENAKKRFGHSGKSRRTSIYISVYIVGYIYMYIYICVYIYALACAYLHTPIHRWVQLSFDKTLVAKAYGGSRDVCCV